MKELKPCPFCGEKHVMHEQGHVIVTETARSGPRYGVSCYSCGGRIEFFDTEAEAVAAWNARAERTCTVVSNCYACDTCGRYLGQIYGSGLHRCRITNALHVTGESMEPVAVVTPSNSVVYYAITRPVVSDSQTPRDACAGWEEA